MVSVGKTNAEVDALIECWPFKSEGPLPQLLADRYYIGDAFFQHLPARRKWPASAIRRGLKQTAKQLGIPFDRSNTGFDQRERDVALAYQFASRPDGRGALRDIEVYVDDVRNRRKRQLVFRIGRTLPEVLWTRYLAMPQYAGLVGWATGIGIARPDLGDPEAFFLTAGSLDNALKMAPPPLALDDPELARVILLFAALLPFDEAVSLTEVAAKHGIVALESVANRPAETVVGGLEQVLGVTPDLPLLAIRTLPTLAPKPPPSITIAPLPKTSAMATDLIESVSVSVEDAARAERRIRSAGSAVELLDLDEDDYAAWTKAIANAREARASCSKAAKRCRDFVRKIVVEVTVSSGLEQPPWLDEVDQAAPVELAQMVSVADAIAHLAQPKIDPGISQIWLPIASRNSNLLTLLDAYRQLPSLRSYVAMIASSEREYVDHVQAFLVAQATSPTDVVAWLRRLSSAEILALLDNVDSSRWPVTAALLTRIGLDGGTGYVKDCESKLLTVSTSKVRRDLLHFVDPTSVVFDGYPNLQRVIIAERLRDALSFGPLVTITDPSLRLAEDRLVGAPIAAFTSLLIHHLDIVRNGTELRRIASIDRNTNGKNDVATELAVYATTTSTSSGFYLMLREAIRERYFAPLVQQGRINVDAVAALVTSFDVEDAIEVAVADVRRGSNRPVRIEPRHRARIQRYVRHGKQLLDAFMQASAPRSQSRQKLFGTELTSALLKLNDKCSSIGSQEWLECEVRGMLLGPEAPFEFATLCGDATLVPERAWTAADTSWAQESMELPEFYLEGSVSTLDVLANAVRHWALGRNPDSEELVGALLARGQFAAARAYVEEGVAIESERTVLIERIAKTASEAIAPLLQRLDALEIKHGAALIGSFSTVTAVRRSLEHWELGEASEQLDFLEMEVSDLVEVDRRNALDASVTVERTTLLRRLLKAGVEGPDERWTLADLESRWNAELLNRAAERVHLRAVEKALSAHEALPELAADAREFSIRMLDPGQWLPERRASELVDFVDAPAEKLRTWIQLAGQIDETQRRALIEVTRWFIRFVEEQTAAVGSLDEGASSDMLLERVLDVGGVIEKSSDPARCAQSLGLTYDALPGPVSNAPARALASETISAKLMSLVEQADWSSLANTARALRFDTSDEDARRMADITEFAETLIGLKSGHLDSARDGLVTSAKVLGASGHFISRALPVSRLLAIAFDLVAAAIACTDKAGARPPTPQPDGSWAPLLDKRFGLLQVLSGNSMATRTLEHLCSGTIGREVINRLWDAPTATAEPGSIRSAILNFLHERGLNEHLLFLAGRHEPGIRSRLEQLLKLRAIVSQRPDLVPVSEAVASQIVKATQGVPFRTFVASLPTAAQTVDADLIVSVDSDIVLRIDKRRQAALSVAVSIEPRGLVPESLEIILFPDDDVSFDDDSRRRRLSEQPVYFASQWTVEVRFGESWKEAIRPRDDNFRIRVNARVLAGELISRDVVCQLTRAELRLGNARHIDDETLLDAFPGVENTPAAGESFIGRLEELERLHGSLVGARRPSPVLLTGMRRIGKTSLLYAFHERHRQPKRDAPVSVYFSLAERRAAMMDPSQKVSAVFYSAIAQALGKRYFSSTDLNGDLGEKLRQRIGTERDAVRNAILELRDAESLADSLTVLSERLLEWAGGATRVIYLVDEAETLVLPYRGGEAKRLELEQLLQGLREVSQTSTKVGLLLSGSNHIAEFARSYKNAFFGSSLQIDLTGMTDPKMAGKLVSPEKLAPYVAFAGEPVRYAIEMCAGMPQFLWQLGAATAAIVRTGPVTKADVRQGVSALVGERSIDLPFKAYEVLEPIEHMLGLQGQREQDMLWLLLWRVANSSSLVVEETQQSYIIDQSLLELDEFDGWKSRLLSLVDLDILEMPRPSMYRFRVPIFAEGFRAPRQQHSYHLRHQRAGT